jgi:hypothetical protein
MKALLLGAGASYEAGMPLVWEFTNVLRANVLRRLDTHLFDFRRNPTFRSHFEAILSNPSLHYEQMVGQLEGIHLNSGPDSHIALQTATQLIDCIQMLLLEDQQKTTPLLAEKAKDYAGLKVLLASQQQVDVFSLNHDVNFEEICRFHKLPCRDGFFDEEIQRYKHIARFKKLTKSQMEAGAMNFHDSGAIGFNLVKLHGSLDVFAVEDKNLYLKITPPEEGRLGDHVAEIYLVENHALKINAQLRTRGVRDLFVTDKEGKLQFLRRSLLSGAHKFKDRFEQIAPIALFKEFRKRLASATELDAIGYGFGDTHINQELAQWMETAPVIMNIYDPNRTAVPSEFVAHTNKIRLLKAGLTDYCEQLSQPNRSLPRRLRRQFLEMSRNRLRRKRLAM